MTTETTSLPNLDYTPVRDLGPGEIIRLRADGVEVLQQPFKREQICSFLWVYYGYPASSYEGRNVEMSRYRSGSFLGSAVL